MNRYRYKNRYIDIYLCIYISGAVKYALLLLLHYANHVYIMSSITPSSVFNVVMGHITVILWVTMFKKWHREFRHTLWRLGYT